MWIQITRKKEPWMAFIEGYKEPRLGSWAFPPMGSPDSFMDPKVIGMLQCFPSPTYIRTHAHLTETLKLILLVVGGFFFFFFQDFYLNAGAQNALCASSRP